MTSLERAIESYESTALDGICTSLIVQSLCKGVIKDVEFYLARALANYV
jgi:hypothetical protein